MEMQNRLKAKSKERSQPAEQTDKERLDSYVYGAMRGDKESLIELCKTISRNVLFRVMRRIHNRMDAEDVAQEILIRVCEKIGTLKTAEAFVGWLNTIIINEINRHAQTSVKQGSVVNIDDYFDDFVDEDSESLPEEYAIREDDRKAVMECIDMLPDRQQEAVLLCYYEGMNVTKAAEVMNVTHQGVSRYLALARNRIKLELTEKNRKTGSLSGIMALPLGPLLGQALQQEATLVAPLSDAVIIQTVSSVANPATAAVAAKTTSGLIIGVTASFAATAIILMGMWFGGVFHNSGNVPQPPIVVVTQGEIVFSGSRSSVSSINPTEATVWGTNELGELIPLHWEIKKSGSTEILYSGEGGDVDETLVSMRKNGEEGVYILSFYMRNEIGGEYRLDREFTIRNP